MYREFTTLEGDTITICEFFKENEWFVTYSIGSKKTTFKLKDCAKHVFKFGNIEISNLDINEVGTKEGIMRDFLLMSYGEDRLEENNDKAETRRHVSLDAFSHNGKLFASNTNNPAEFDVFPEDGGTKDNSADTDTLQPILNKLTAKQAELVHALFVEGISASEFARQKKVTRAAVSQLLAKAKKKIEQLLEQKD